MNVVRAQEMGMCFGVRDALRVTEAVSNPENVTIHGQLVHNGEVLRRLASKGFGMTSEAQRDRIPETPLILITAHGISDRERARLEAGGKQLLDSTCPLVVRAHEAARQLREKGYFLIVIGRPGHVEIRGIVEDLEPGLHAVVESVEEVRSYPSTRLGIVSQTTSSQALVSRVREAVEAANPGAEIRFIDTICLPTKERQRSLEHLSEYVDAVVVVGGWNSNNTKELVTLCRSQGTPALHIESAADLDPNWFRGFRTIGLTAGTSTLDATIEAVHRALLELPEAVEASSV